MAHDIIEIQESYRDGMDKVSYRHEDSVRDSLFPIVDYRTSRKGLSGHVYPAEIGRASFRYTDPNKVEAFALALLRAAGRMRADQEAAYVEEPAGLEK